MALSLVDAPSAIQQSSSGLISIRLEDYVAAGATTVSDSLSVAGTVVLEDQALSVATTNAQAAITARWAAAANTIEIPKTDILAFGAADTVYDMFLGFKILGDVPSNAVKFGTWRTFNNGGGGAMVAFGRDTTYMGSPGTIHTSVYGDQYRLQKLPDLNYASLNLGTNLVFRAWGITGGDVEFYLDVLYLMPDTGDWIARREFPATDFPPNQLDADGTWDIGPVDTDDTDNPIGEFSVTRTDQAMIGARGLLDHQDAPDEPTMYNANGSGSLTDDPPTRLAIAYGSLYVPTVTLIDDDFSQDSASIPQVGPEIIAGPQGYNKFSGFDGFTVPHSGGQQGWTCSGGVATCAYGVNQVYDPPGGTWPHSYFNIGTYDRDPIGGGPATDPRSFQRTLGGLEDATSEFVFSCDAHTSTMTYGLGGFHTGVAAIEDPIYGVRISISSGGVLAVELGLQFDTTVQVEPTWFPVGGGPVTIDGAYAGAAMRLKLEKLRYIFRVKCWVDGAGEPGAWDIEEYMPIGWRKSTDASTFCRDIVEYPYSTNWTTSADHDVVAAGPPWINPGSMAAQNFGFVPDFVVFPNGDNGVNPETIWTLDDFTLTVEDHGSSPVDTFLQEEKWDGSVQWGDIQVPWGSHRFIEGSQRVRLFNGDTEGYNLQSWLSGQPTSQAGMIMYVFETSYESSGGIVSLSHLRSRHRYAGVTSIRSGTVQTP